MRNNFSKRLPDVPLLYLLKVHGILFGFVFTLFELVPLFICGRRKLAVSRLRMICVVPAEMETPFTLLIRVFMDRYFERCLYFEKLISTS